jgi:hypothetical protein
MLNANPCHPGDAPGRNKTYSIMVNGRPRTTTEHKLSYIEAVHLAYPGEQLRITRFGSPASTPAAPAVCRSRRWARKPPLRPSARV